VAASQRAPSDKKTVDQRLPVAVDSKLQQQTDATATNRGYDKGLVLFLLPY